MVLNLDEQLVNKILSFPDAPIFVNTLSDKLKEENKRRKQFYNDITERDKAEFINGEVVIHSPVKKEHNDALTLLSALIIPFVNIRDLGYTGVEKIMITLTRNDYEPDLCFFQKSKSQHFKSGQVLFPAPDLVVEILSDSTIKNDRTLKFKDYEAHKVQEYWIVDPSANSIEQYQLNEVGKYELTMKAQNGEIESVAIKGFKIPVLAIFDKTTNNATLKSILK